MPPEHDLFDPLDADDRWKIAEGRYLCLHDAMPDDGKNRVFLSAFFTEDGTAWDCYRDLTLAERPTAHGRADTGKLRAAIAAAIAESDGPYEFEALPGIRLPLADREQAELFLRFFRPGPPPPADPRSGGFSSGTVDKPPGTG